MSELLGSGGFGEVYSGIRRKDHLAVAIKEVHTNQITEWGQVNTQFNTLYIQTESTVLLHRNINYIIIFENKLLH